MKKRLMPSAIFLVSSKVPFVAALQAKKRKMLSPAHIKPAAINAIPAAPFPPKAKMPPTNKPAAQAIKEANTGSKVFLKGTISILDAIEDVDIFINKE